MPRASSRSLVGCVKWQEDADGCAVPVRFTIALNVNPTSVPFDKLLCDEQSDSCADCSPCREEGVENLRQIRRCNSHSIVLDRQDNPIARTRSITYGKRESSTLGHGID